MTSSPERDGARRVPEDMPPALRSMWRLCRLGYRHEPALLLAAFVLALAAALPDALLALWIKFLGQGVLEGDRRLLVVASVGLGGSTAATWILRTVSTRVQRRFRDRVTIALESHVARLQASVATIAHQERPDYLDRLSVLREQVFVLDHMYMSLFTTAGWILRLAVTVALLMSVHPALVLLAVLAVPTVLTSTWRPAVERRAQEQGAQAHRLARHLFVTATTAPPGKEVRVTGIGRRLVAGRRAAWERWYGPVSRTRITSAVWHTLGWAVFGCGYVGAVVFVAAGLDAGPAAVLLVLAAGARLSAYIGATVGEIGFLRGIWMDGSRRLAWLEDYAAALVASADLPVPATLAEGIRLEHVSFAYPGTDRLVLDDVSLDLPAGSVVAIVGENGAGKTTLVKLLCKLYEPTAGRVLVDGAPLARMPADEWRTRLAGAFQDFFRFELRARHSVGLGDVPRVDDDRAVTTAVDRAGADDVIARLAAGLETQLGRTWPDGVEVSFGQWQKLALARGFMRDDPLLLILDEPTAALDAETEHALFERYAAAAHGGGSRAGQPSHGAAHGAALGAITGGAVGSAVGGAVGSANGGGVGHGSRDAAVARPRDGSGVGSDAASSTGPGTRPRDRTSAGPDDGSADGGRGESRDGSGDRPGDGSRDGSGDGSGDGGRGQPAAGAADGRITILVSHRFSTVRMADLIVVLDGARLVEVGTHDDLMARGGRYAELYGIQAAAYR